MGLSRKGEEMDARSQSRVSSICRVDAWLASLEASWYTPCSSFASASHLGHISYISWFILFCRSFVKLFTQNPATFLPGHISYIMSHSQPPPPSWTRFSIASIITIWRSGSSPLNPSVAGATDTISSPRGTCHPFLRITHRRQEAIYSCSYGCAQDPGKKSFGC